MFCLLLYFLLLAFLFGDGLLLFLLCFALLFVVFIFIFVFAFIVDIFIFAKAVNKFRLINLSLNIPLLIKSFQQLLRHILLGRPDSNSVSAY